MINLLSPHIKEERAYGRRNVSMLTYVVILFVTALGVMTIMYGGIQFTGPNEDSLKKEIDEFSVEIAALETSVKEIENVASRLETAKKIDDLSVEFSTLVPEIATVLPKGVILNSLSLEGSTTTDPLQLNVDLQSADLVPVTIKNLVESELFEAADLSSISPIGSSSDPGTSVYNFNASITASFTGTADAKKKAATPEVAQ